MRFGGNRYSLRTRRALLLRQCVLRVTRRDRSDAARSDAAEGLVRSIADEWHLEAVLFPQICLVLATGMRVDNPEDTSGSVNPAMATLECVRAPAAPSVTAPSGRSRSRLRTGITRWKDQTSMLRSGRAHDPVV